MGEVLTRTTADVAVVCYFIGLSLRIANEGPSARLTKGRLLWTAGCVLVFLHLACAFHFIHHWSHEQAIKETARQTEAVLGWNWGGGIYVNYVFSLVWLADMSWWWFDPSSYVRRARTLELFVHGFLGFIMFNATIVFGEGLARWLGIAGGLALIEAWRRRPRG